MANDYFFGLINWGGDADARDKQTTRAEIIIDYGPLCFPCGLLPSFQLYSSTVVDPVTKKGRLSKKAFLDKKGNMKALLDNQGTRDVKKDIHGKVHRLAFHLEPDFGTPGALLVKNKYNRRFFLRSVTVTTGGEFNAVNVFFDCRSWIYPIKETKQSRVFFSNASYLPSQTPRALKELRERELKQLRGEYLTQNSDGQERQEWERIYNYDYYNDLGNPDKARDFARPVLGGSPQYPYPRRLRTGRPSSKQDIMTESRPPVNTAKRIYVPPDERFSPQKALELKENFAKALSRFLMIETAQTSSSSSSRSIKTSDEPLEFFKDKERRGLDEWERKRLLNLVPDLDREIYQQSKKDPMDVPLPSIIAENEWAYVDDQEFGRQMLAGINPTRIQLLKEFPQTMTNDNGSSNNAMNRVIKELCRNQNSQKFESGDEAIKQKKMFILDHYEYLEPYLQSINKREVQAYASRTVLWLTEEATLEPVAIELTGPSSSNLDKLIPRVFFRPFEANVHAQALWLLAKLHVASNDTAHHLLISHWLHTHAVVEPFIIAARRQLSTMHPIYRLLDPHFKDTLHANALARGMVINAGGILETLCFTGEVSAELSSKLYKEWRFDEQALPHDLIKRGMAEKSADDSGKVEVIIKNKLEDPDTAIPDLEESDYVKLLIKDYPFAVDGLEIWSVIKTWVTSYCLIFYQSDNSVMHDSELQGWWKEVQDLGHPEQKDGWYDITTQSDLIRALTTLIWICSALHAAVNFGQYAYAGFPPNRPTLLHKLIPEGGSEQYNKLEEEFDEFFCTTLPDRFEMGMVVALMYVLSQHSCDDLYLGQREATEWTDNDVVKLKLEEFQDNLKKVEKRILARNKDYSLQNRWGPAKIPYKLLYPDTAEVVSKKGITWRGIPNSISI